MVILDTTAPFEGYIPVVCDTDRAGFHLFFKGRASRVLRAMVTGDEDGDVRDVWLEFEGQPDYVRLACQPIEVTSAIVISGACQITARSDEVEDVYEVRCLDVPNNDDTMSLDQAIAALSRYEELVRVKTFVPDGWDNWRLEFRMGQFDNDSVCVDAVFDADGGNRRTIILVHRGEPDDLQDEIRQAQMEAPHLHLGLSYFQRFATLPNVDLPTALIDKMKSDLAELASCYPADAQKVFWSKKIALQLQRSRGLTS